MKKSDWILIGSILLAGLILFCGVRVWGRPQQETNFVRISVDGQEYQTVPLGKVQRVVVDRHGIHNVIAISADGDVYMEESNCENQDCIHQGRVNLGNIYQRPLGNMIVCLPNRVVVELIAAPQLSASPRP